MDAYQLAWSLEQGSTVLPILALCAGPIALRGAARATMASAAVGLGGLVLSDAARVFGGEAAWEHTDWWATQVGWLAVAAVLFAGQRKQDLDEPAARGPEVGVLAVRAVRLAA